MLTDPIADMLTRLRNANKALLEQVEMPSSKLKVELARILRDEGFIKGYQAIPDGKQGMLKIELKYGPGNERVLQGLRRASRPGLRVYAKTAKVPRLMHGIGVAIVSTSQGVMSGEEARRRQVGGEVLCYVW